MAALSSFACKAPSPPSIILKNDTIAIIELTIRRAYYRRELSELKEAEKKYIWKDSILLTSDSAFLAFLPKAIDSLKFKILSKKDICRILNTENDLKKVPNYLALTTLERNDTGYYINFASLGCREFSAGGSMSLEILKTRDSLKISSARFSNLN